MIVPVRIQRKRVEGYDMQKESKAINGLEAKSVTRPHRYGNPFKVGERNDMGEIVTPEKCLEYFEYYLRRKYKGNALAEFLEPLRGYNLACFCKLTDPCHTDVLLKLLTETSKPPLETSYVQYSSYTQSNLLPRLSLTDVDEPGE